MRASKRKRLRANVIAEWRDSILTEIEEAVDRMSLLQAKEFLYSLQEDIVNKLGEINDKISFIRANTKCTCKERGRTGLHAKKCAKTKAVM